MFYFEAIFHVVARVYDRTKGEDHFFRDRLVSE